MNKKVFLGLIQYSNKVISGFYIKNKNTGLGDMLFQVSSGLCYAYNNNAELFVPSLNIYFKLENLKKEETIFKYINTSLDKNYDEKKIIKYKDVRTNIHKINFFNNIHLKSYFINIDNFNKNKNLILKYFLPNEEEKSYLFKKYPVLIQKKNNLCSIHIRRGPDYIKLFKKNLYVFEKQYFNLLEHMIEKKNIKNFFVITNDRIYCQKIFDNNPKYNNINFYYSNERDFYDIWLISLIKNNIVSTSKLAWWGSYLNIVPDRYIIYSKNDVRRVELNNDWILIE